MAIKTAVVTVTVKLTNADDMAILQDLLDEFTNAIAGSGIAKSVDSEAAMTSCTHRRV